MRLARTARALSVGFALVPALALFGCAPELLGPTPALQDPAPGALPVEPALLCRAQHPAQGTPVAVHGAGFAPLAFDVPNRPTLALPELTLVGGRDVFGDAAATGDVVYAGVPGGSNAELLSWQSEAALGFLITDELELADGRGPAPAALYDVRVENADGQRATAERALALIEPPTITAIDPPFVCLEQGPRTVTVMGTDLLRLGEVLPVAEVGGVSFTPVLGDCRAVAHPGVDAELCATATIELPRAAFAAGPQGVTLANPAPASCTSAAAELVVVPPPAIDSVAPDALCTASGLVDVVVSGSGFLIADGVGPTLTVGGAGLTPTDFTGCAPVAVTGVTVESCSGFTFSVDPASWAAGSVEVALVNPPPGDCAATAHLLAVPPPSIEQVAPPAVCQEPGLVELTVTGSGFARVNGVDFTVSVGGVDQAPTSMSCAPVVVTEGSLELCDSFVVSVEPGAFAESDVDVTVTNPTDNACSASADWLLYPVPIIAAAAPNGVCSALAGPATVVVSGSGFLRIDGADFTVSVAGTPVTPSNIGGCAPLTLPGAVAESCASFEVSFDASALAEGGVDISVTNPAPASCQGGSSDAFQIFGPPTIAAIVPAQVCADVGTAFDVIGAGLGAGSTVSVGGSAPDSVVANADGSLTVVFDDGLPAGSYDVTVDNGGCAATAPGALLVNPSPLVFFVDPPVLYNGIALEATIFVSGIDADAAAVELIDPSGAATSLDFSSPIRPQRIQATVAAGMAPGDYAVRVTSVDGCQSALDGRVSVTDQLSIDLVAVSPSFVSPTVPTALTVSAEPSAATFVNLPRVYLSPAGGGGNAIALRAVELFSATQLSAVVTGAAPNSYDLIVVNPTGEVGLLPAAVTVSADEPPVITSVAPGAFDAGAVSSAEIHGRDFHAQATVGFTCRDFATGAAVTAPSAQVDAATATTLTVTIDGGGVPQGAVCIVIVANPDGASFPFSAISFRNPSQNLNPLRPGAAMAEARRGLSLLAGRPTETSRFLYAVGGDGGAASSAKTSVESVPVDAFGEMGTWAAQRNTLQNAFDGTQVGALPRTLAGGARVGRFLYLAGGNDGSGPVSTLLRAQILDPLAGPEIADLDVVMGDGTVGLSQGLYIYRVSALFPLGDPSNPGGESLAGDVFSVQVPQVDDLLVLTLRWAAVPGASGYRVFRTALPDQSADAVQLIATLTGGASTSFVDDGTATPDPGALPLPAGSLGVWHASSPLGVPRAAHATVVVPAPAADSFYLYAMGGLSTGGAPAASGEVATVTVNGDGSQDVSAWRPLTAALPSARSELAGLAITPADTPRTGGETLLYFACGRLGSGQLTADIEAAAIEADGDVLALTRINAPPNGDNAPNPARVGAAGIAANGFLYLFGGSNGSPSNNDTSAELSTSAPYVEQWDALGGGGMLEARVSHAATVESAFFFVGGGRNAAGPIATIDRTIQ